MEQTPYAGTSNWAALAFRHILDRVSNDGSYKGVAWLDGDMEGLLQKDTGTHSKIFIGGWPDKPSRTKISELKPQNEMDRQFKKILEKKEGYLIPEMDSRSKDVKGVAITRKGKPPIELVLGKDYFIYSGDEAFNDTVLVRKNLFTPDERKLAGSETRGEIFYAKEYSKIITKIDGDHPILDVLHDNGFLLFQDKILPDAFKKQMVRNGLEPNVVYDKDKGLHIAAISDYSQRLILERGQPKYAPVKTIEEFKPLTKAESVPLVQPFYSSLERLIENQRPLDKRNGTQWRKYLIAEGMSKAEMKVTGVWDVLEKSKTKKVTQARLLKVINNPENDLTSKSISVQQDYENFSTASFRWDQDFKIQKLDVDDYPNIIYHLKDHGEHKGSNKYAYVAEGKDTADFVSINIIRITRKDGNVKYGWILDSENRDDAVVGRTFSDSLEDAKHIGREKALSELEYFVFGGANDVEMLGSVGRDWRGITIEQEFNHLGNEIPENYQERIVMVPELRRGVTHHLDDGITNANIALRGHLKDAIDRYKAASQLQDLDIDIRNAAVHYRTTDYKINGENYLLIQEIQSDFFQKLRRKYDSDTGNKAYKNFIETTPYSGTNHWVSLAFRDALDAVVKEGDYKGIAWLDGKLASNLESADLYLFQEKIVTEAIRKQMKRSGITLP